MDNPFVHKAVQVINDDSIVFKLYFVSLYKEYGMLNVNINKGKKMLVNLFDDTVYSYMKSASFGFNTSGTKEIRVDWSVNYQNKWVSHIESIVDSIELLRSEDH